MVKFKFPGKPSKLIQRSLVSAYSIIVPSCDTSSVSEDVCYGLSLFEDTFGTDDEVECFRGFNNQEIEEANNKRIHYDSEIQEKFASKGIVYTPFVSQKKMSSIVAQDIKEVSKPNSSSQNSIQKSKNNYISRQNNRERMKCIKLRLLNRKPLIRYHSKIQIRYNFKALSKNSSLMRFKHKSLSNCLSEKFCRKFTLPSRSLHSSRVIKPNKRFVDTEKITKLRNNYQSNNIKVDAPLNKVIIREARLNITTEPAVTGPFSAKRCISSDKEKHKSSSVACGICGAGAVRNHKHTMYSKRFGAYKCEPCRRFTHKGNVEKDHHMPRGPRIKHVCRSALSVLKPSSTAFNGEEVEDSIFKCENSVRLSRKNNDNKTEKVNQLNKVRQSNDLVITLVDNQMDAEDSCKSGARTLNDFREESCIESYETENKLLSTDFWEPYDENYVYKTGFPLISSEPLNVRAVCFLCGSAGIEKLLYCVSCCEPYHWYCTQDSFLFREKGEFEKYRTTWICTKCKVRPASDEPVSKLFTSCQKCKNSQTEYDNNKLFSKFDQSRVVENKILQTLPKRYNCSCDERNASVIEEEYIALRKLVAAEEYRYENFKMLDLRKCNLCKRTGEAIPSEGGRLIYCGQNEWVHSNCALWSNEVFEKVDGSLQNVHAAIFRGRQIRCTVCEKKGASVGCYSRNCSLTYHFLCARKACCVFLQNNSIYCRNHHVVDEASLQPLINDEDFEIPRPIHVEMDRKKNKKLEKLSHAANVKIRIGSLHVENLGKIDPHLSDNPKYILPIYFRCNRLFWSISKPWKIIQYHIQIMLRYQDVNCDSEPNYTIDHSTQSAAGTDGADSNEPPSKPKPANTLSLYNERCGVKRKSSCDNSTTSPSPPPLNNGAAKKKLFDTNFINAEKLSTPIDDWFQDYISSGKLKETMDEYFQDYISAEKLNSTIDEYLREANKNYNKFCQPYENILQLDGMVDVYNNDEEPVKCIKCHRTYRTTFSFQRHLETCNSDFSDYMISSCESDSASSEEERFSCSSELMFDADKYDSKRTRDDDDDEDDDAFDLVDENGEEKIPPPQIIDDARSVCGNIELLREAATYPYATAVTPATYEDARTTMENEHQKQHHYHHHLPNDIVLRTVLENLKQESSLTVGTQQQNGCCVPVNAEHLKFDLHVAAKLNPEMTSVGDYTPQFALTNLTAGETQSYAQVHNVTAAPTFVIQSVAKPEAMPTYIAVGDTAAIPPPLQLQQITTMNAPTTVNYQPVVPTTVNYQPIVPTVLSAIMQPAGIIDATPTTTYFLNTAPSSADLFASQNNIVLPNQPALLYGMETVVSNTVLSSSQFVTQSLAGGGDFGSSTMYSTTTMQYFQAAKQVQPDFAPGFVVLNSAPLTQAATVQPVHSTTRPIRPPNNSVIAPVRNNNDDNNVVLVAAEQNKRNNRYAETTKATSIRKNVASRNSVKKPTKIMRVKNNRPISIRTISGGGDGETTTSTKNVKKFPLRASGCENSGKYANLCIKTVDKPSIIEEDESASYDIYNYLNFKTNPDGGINRDPSDSAAARKQTTRLPSFRQQNVDIFADISAKRKLSTVDSNLNFPVNNNNFNGGDVRNNVTSEDKPIVTDSPRCGANANSVNASDQTDSVRLVSNNRAGVQSETADTTQTDSLVRDTNNPTKWSANSCAVPWPGHVTRPQSNRRSEETYLDRSFATDSQSSTCENVENSNRIIFDNMPRIGGDYYVRDANQHHHRRRITVESPRTTNNVKSAPSLANDFHLQNLNLSVSDFNITNSSSNQLVRDMPCLDIFDIALPVSVVAAAEGELNKSEVPNDDDDHHHHHQHSSNAISDSDKIFDELLRQHKLSMENASLKATVAATAAVDVEFNEKPAHSPNVFQGTTATSTTAATLTTVAKQETAKKSKVIAKNKYKPQCNRRTKSSFDNEKNTVTTKDGKTNVVKKKKSPEKENLDKVGGGQPSTDTKTGKNWKTPSISYEVNAEDGFTYKTNNLLDLWNKILESVQKSRANYKLPLLPQNALVDSDSVYSLLGFENNASKHLLEQLPDAWKCIFYKPAFHKSPFHNNKTLLIKNESGCARTEPYNCSNKYDMFGWLASRHRKVPKLSRISDSEIVHGISRRITSLNLPMAMRFRHLKESAKLTVGVFRSDIHGRGLFCLRTIEFGEMVIEYAGEVIRSMLTDKREKYYTSKGIGCYMFRIDDNHVVDATMFGNAARFINHSCEPNCYSRIVDISGKKHILIFALRKIPEGEELTYDYKFPLEDDKIFCHCLSRKCRKYLN